MTIRYSYVVGHRPTGRICKPGSLDASITDEAANDFPGFFDKHPNITHVFFNGMKAKRAFRRHALPALTEDQHIFARLPSTSPAHTAMTLEAKVQAWCVVRKILSQLAEISPLCRGSGFELREIFANGIANEPRGTGRYKGSQANTVTAKLANWSTRLGTRRYDPARES
jgi:hypothetical protein